MFLRSLTDASPRFQLLPVTLLLAIWELLLSRNSWPWARLCPGQKQA
jgi:hypothetical protein